MRKSACNPSLPLAVAALIFLALCPALLRAQVDIPLSPVGNAGNAPDSSTGYGEVDSAYNIGTYDVTIAQYCAFLNAVATTADSYGLYDPLMSDAGNFSGAFTGSGIVRTQTNGVFTYTVIGSSGNEPATYVSWLDAARFCNWMQNGQPVTGVEDVSTTEEGAYTLDGEGDYMVSGSQVIPGVTGTEARNPGATWYIPNENEWYKAAYYNPVLNSGSGGYWTYATQSNATPQNTTGGAANGVNYLLNNTFSALGTGSYLSNQDYMTRVGAFTNSQSYYGTFDQDGDVFQWNEAISHVNSRGLRGGSWYSGLNIMQSANRSQGGPSGGGYDIGFRIAASTAVSAPVIVTQGAQPVSGSEVILTGTLDLPAAAVSGSAYFLYGQRSLYSAVTVPVQYSGSGSVVVISTTVTGLTPETVYHYSLVATTGAMGSSVQSPDATFVTGAQYAIALSQVGNPGAAPDPQTGYGEVDYTYEIGTYDVTNSQYCTFLNAVATSADPYGLYTPSMCQMDGTNAGISRSGTAGSYRYSIMGNVGNDPVTYVSWLDAARFCNWVQNGQLMTGTENAATTETGAYALNGDTTGGLETVTPAVSGTTWCLPSEDQWYKAAYFDATLNSGAGGYWIYPTRSNSTPGNTVGSGANQANYFNTSHYSATGGGAYLLAQNYLTQVGAFTNSTGPWGTYDQGGDVYQWNDAVINGIDRGLRGGNWNSSGPFGLQSSNRARATGADASGGIGFRVAAITASAAPRVAGSGVASVSNTGAVVTGTVTANGADTIVYVLYGNAPPAYSGSRSIGDIGSAYGTVAVSTTLSGLISGNNYSCKVVAVNSNGTGQGNVSTFNTTQLQATNNYAMDTGTSSVIIRPSLGSGITITAASTPSLGSAVISGGGTTITYTPNFSFGGYAGTDTFTYTVSNGQGGTATAEVVIGNPFYIQKGNYAATFANGYLTMTTGATGAFTAKLRRGTTAYGFKGVFDPATGYYAGIVGNDLVTMQFDIKNFTGSANGQYVISGTCTGAAFTAYHALYNPVSNPAPQAGYYTMLLPAVSNSDPDVPAGTGFATLIVGESGNVTIAGILGDGAGFTDGVFITGGTNAGANILQVSVPIAYKSAGVLSGTLAFGDNPTVNDCDGSLTWQKPVQSAGAYYRDGFFTTLSATCSRYAQPAQGTIALTTSDITPNASISLSEPDFPFYDQPITHQLSITPGPKVTTDTVTVLDPGDDGLVLGITTSNGAVSGSFIDPVTNKRVAIKGIIVFKQGQAGGLFTSPTQSGYFSITPY